MEEVEELRSVTDAELDWFLFPSSPLAPAYARICEAINKREVERQKDLKDACRSFENYLVEMIVEEGKVGDLMDVEEFLYCWKNLTSPVFTDLVCRFYGELCKDLFSGDEGEGDVNDPN
ncbi:PREDICTED: transcription repressor OFP17 [Nelumbo nucifera]|uniref:OVATE domain-containing protein n=2 Tax=Nelumbo nucifera TaxID=4432 RepID=A0A822Z4N4_NELNU|nr:PREDICTED: transcription repressor OFP17 [Nelumbo nucifera]DAD38641.1 TPA_asm: hypothetical protein HUJ06_012963 [Nelumbo nucifera]